MVLSQTVPQFVLDEVLPVKGASLVRRKVSTVPKGRGGPLPIVGVNVEVGKARICRVRDGEAVEALEEVWDARKVTQEIVRGLVVDSHGDPWACRLERNVDLLCPSSSIEGVPNELGAFALGKAAAKRDVQRPHRVFCTWSHKM